MENDQNARRQTSRAGEGWPLAARRLLTRRYEPRGCPRGASFSWYTYSPSRVRYPYVRGELLKLWREARRRLGDPAAAWAEITSDPAKARAYKPARGKGGLVRADWDAWSVPIGYLTRPYLVYRHRGTPPVVTAPTASHTTRGAA